MNIRDMINQVILTIWIKDGNPSNFWTGFRFLQESVQINGGFSADSGVTFRQNNFPKQSLMLRNFRQLKTGDQN